eukprot:g7657.t1
MKQKRKKGGMEQGAAASTLRSPGGAEDNGPRGENYMEPPGPLLGAPASGPLDSASAPPPSSRTCASSQEGNTPCPPSSASSAGVLDPGVFSSTATATSNAMARAPANKPSKAAAARAGPARRQQNQSTKGGDHEGPKQDVALSPLPSHVRTALALEFLPKNLSNEELKQFGAALWLDRLLLVKKKQFASAREFLQQLSTPAAAADSGNSAAGQHQLRATEVYTYAPAAEAELPRCAGLGNPEGAPPPAPGRRDHIVGVVGNRAPGAGVGGGVAEKPSESSCFLLLYSEAEADVAKLQLSRRLASLRYLVYEVSRVTQENGAPVDLLRRQVVLEFPKSLAEKFYQLQGMAMVEEGDVGRGGGKVAAREDGEDGGARGGAVAGGRERESQPRAGNTAIGKSKCRSIDEGALLEQEDEEESAETAGGSGLSGGSALAATKTTSKKRDTSFVPPANSIPSPGSDYALLHPQRNDKTPLIGPDLAHGVDQKNSTDQHTTPAQRNAPDPIVDEVEPLPGPAETHPLAFGMVTDGREDTEPVGMDPKQLQKALQATKELKITNSEEQDDHGHAAVVSEQRQHGGTTSTTTAPTAGVVPLKVSASTLFATWFRDFRPSEAEQDMAGVIGTELPAKLLASGNLRARLCVPVMEASGSANKTAAPAQADVPPEALSVTTPDATNGDEMNLPTFYFKNRGNLEYFYIQPKARMQWRLDCVFQNHARSVVFHCSHELGSTKLLISTFQRADGSRGNKPLISTSCSSGGSVTRGSSGAGGGTGMGTASTSQTGDHSRDSNTHDPLRDFSFLDLPSTVNYGMALPSPAVSSRPNTKKPAASSTRGGGAGRTSITTTSSTRSGTKQSKSSQAGCTSCSATTPKGGEDEDCDEQELQLGGPPEVTRWYLSDEAGDDCSGKPIATYSERLREMCDAWDLELTVKNSFLSFGTSGTDRRLTRSYSAPIERGASPEEPVPGEGTANSDRTQQLHSVDEVEQEEDQHLHHAHDPEDPPEDHPIQYLSKKSLQQLPLPDVISSIAQRVCECRCRWVQHAIARASSTNAHAKLKIFDPDSKNSIRGFEDLVEKQRQREEKVFAERLLCSLGSSICQSNQWRLCAPPSALAFGMATGFVSYIRANSLTVNRLFPKFFDVHTLWVCGLSIDVGNPHLYKHIKNCDRGELADFLKTLVKSASDQKRKKPMKQLRMTSGEVLDLRWSQQFDRADDVQKQYKVVGRNDAGYRRSSSPRLRGSVPQKSDRRTDTSGEDHHHSNIVESVGAKPRDNKDKEERELLHGFLRENGHDPQNEEMLHEGFLDVGEEMHDLRLPGKCYDSGCYEDPLKLAGHEVFVGGAGDVDLEDEEVEDVDNKIVIPEALRCLLRPCNREFFRSQDARLWQLELERVPTNKPTLCTLPKPSYLDSTEALFQGMASKQFALAGESGGGYTFHATKVAQSYHGLQEFIRNQYDLGDKLNVAHFPLHCSNHFLEGYLAFTQFLKKKHAELLDFGEAEGNYAEGAYNAGGVDDDAHDVGGTKMNEEGLQPVSKTSKNKRRNRRGGNKAGGAIKGGGAATSNEGSVRKPRVDLDNVACYASSLLCPMYIDPVDGLAYFVDPVGIVSLGKAEFAPSPGYEGYKGPNADCGVDVGDVEDEGVVQSGEDLPDQAAAGYFPKGVTGSGKYGFPTRAEFPNVADVAHQGAVNGLAEDPCTSGNPHPSAAPQQRPPHAQHLTPAALALQQRLLLENGSAGGGAARLPGAFEQLYDASQCSAPPAGMPLLGGVGEY